MPISAEDAQGVLSRAECLFDDEQVQAALDSMANEISEIIKVENPLVICVLTGDIITSRELLKRFSLTLPVVFFLLPL